MTRLLETLPVEARRRLRAISRTAEDVYWPALLAKELGWRVANRLYQTEQRRLGRLEMMALLEALNLRPPLGPELAREVLLTAIEFYLRSNGIAAYPRLEGDRIRIDVSHCPIIERLENPSWQGVTACGCFARRRGWYDALGIQVDEHLVLNRKWGDHVCRLILRLPEPVALAA